MSSPRHGRWVPEMPDAYVGVAADDDDGTAWTSREGARQPLTTPRAHPSPAPPRRRVGVVTPAARPLVRPAAAPAPYRAVDMASPPAAPPPHDADRSLPWARRAPARAQGGPVALGVALRLVAWMLRGAAVTLCALVVANATAWGFMRLSVLDVTARVSALLPDALSGALTVRTPLGGSFRGDLAVSAIMLFVCDWLCAWRAARVSHR